MNSSDYKAVQEILEVLYQEYNDLEFQINEHLLGIREADSYLRSFFENEDESSKIFSPRNAKDIHHEEIEDTVHKKNQLEAELSQYYRTRNILSCRIKKIERIMKNYEESRREPDVRKQKLAILSIQEEDRQRIARDLHDTSLQNLAYLIHKIELSSMFIEQDPVKAKMELSIVTQNLHRIIDEIRNTVFDLSSMTFDDLGLKSAFQNLVDNINEKHQYIIDMNVENPACEDNLVLTTIYRIVNECLGNIVKHSGAEKILFHCKNDNGNYIIDIEDNGKGFSKEEVAEKRKHHFGVKIMMERVKLLDGKIEFHSKKGEGTHIHIEIPLENIYVS